MNFAFQEIGTVHIVSECVIFGLLLIKTRKDEKVFTRNISHLPFSIH